MADDLSSFIENQKNKLEKERAELTRDGNYNFTSQDRQVRLNSLVHCISFMSYCVFIKQKTILIYLFFLLLMFI